MVRCLSRNHSCTFSDNYIKLNFLKRSINKSGFYIISQLFLLCSELWINYFGAIRRSGGIFLQLAMQDFTSTTSSYLPCLRIVAFLLCLDLNRLWRKQIRTDLWWWKIDPSDLAFMNTENFSVFGSTMKVSIKFVEFFFFLI